MSRKRKCHDACGVSAEGSRKRLKQSRRAQDPLEHAVLSSYYPTILTLRGYLLSKLPSSAKSRRRRVASAGLDKITRDQNIVHQGVSEWDTSIPAPEYTSNKSYLANVLDNSLVGLSNTFLRAADNSNDADLAAFSQRVSGSSISSSEIKSTSMSDVVDLAIWLLFHKINPNVHKPAHLLCHGYQRAHVPKQTREGHSAVASIPGIVSHYPNNHVSTLKNAVWSELFDLLGKERERIMLDLILDSLVYCPAAMVFEARIISPSEGKPLSEMPILQYPTSGGASGRDRPVSLEPQSNLKIKQQAELHTPGAVIFVRNRLLYARAALNAKGEIRLGLRHIHVLNRYPDSKSPGHVTHLMMYIFPRQFGLHNVFTSKVDPRETVQPFKDYTLREQEIVRMKRKQQFKNSALVNNISEGRILLPRRLRGKPAGLVKKLQILHARCSYTELLKHYCPVNTLLPPRPNRTNSLRRGLGLTETAIEPAAQKIGQTPSNSIDFEEPRQKQVLIDFATSPANVSGFCRAVLSKLIPCEFWGNGDCGDKNKRTIMSQVDRFLTLRRFESLSLNSVSEGIKITGIHWLIPPKIRADAKTSFSDMQKRKEIFLEFIYYVFDSLVIPLVRSNFHVTESSIHRNRLFFFRHDVWRALTEPAIAELKRSIFEEMPIEKAKKILDARSLGFSQIRLLPKGIGFRPITNLRRRVTKFQNGKLVLGRSINSVMAPVFNLLGYEKLKQPERVGSALFSVSDMYPKLKTFQTQLKSECGNVSLFFAKVDVQSCFDTIPQRNVVRLMEQLASESQYRIARHAEIKPSEHRSGTFAIKHTSKPMRKFIAKAQAAQDFSPFSEMFNENLTNGKKNTVFVDSVVQAFHDKEKLLDLLEEHVKGNLVKVGKKFFRQKEGIPQGSVLSSLLCTFFYAEMGKECLAFLDESPCILLRLIDDFLLITTNKSHADRFLQVMLDGNPKYGIKVNPQKTLVNFETVINDIPIPRLPTSATSFPYCGDLINTRTLELTKDRDRRKVVILADSLTIEHSKAPGRTFHRKALSTFKLQAHAMFLDTTFNSIPTVLTTLYQNCLETAMKFYRYLKCLPSSKRPRPTLLIKTIHDLSQLAIVMTKSNRHKCHAQQQWYRCAVTERQMQWLMTTAFRNVLGRKQTLFREVIAWVDGMVRAAAPKDEREKARLGRAVEEGERVFAGYKY